MFMYKLPTHIKPSFDDIPTNEKKTSYELVKKVCNYVPHSDRQVSIQYALITYYSYPTDMNKTIVNYLLEKAIKYRNNYQYEDYGINTTTRNFYKYCKKAFDEISKLH